VATERRAAIESISAVTLAVADMHRSVAFYRALGFVVRYGGDAASFTSFSVGGSYLNLEQAGGAGDVRPWGRIVFHVADVDALYGRALDAGFAPSTTPRDAPWGERFFHLSDPDGHELSFARPLVR
jgi:catechol 2,3-dioxygenase-like lactoylglutathione lyase family enzyme